MAFSYKEGFIRNREAFMIGMPRLRQKRIKEGERIEEKSIRGSILMSARLRSFKKNFRVTDNFYLLLVIFHRCTYRKRRVDNCV